MLGVNNISSFLRTMFFLVLIASLFNTIASSLGLGFPYNTFLFLPEDVFADFFKVMDALKIVETWPGINAYQEIGINHMPPLAVSVYVCMAYCIKFLAFTKATTYLLIFVLPLLILLLQSSFFSNKSRYWFLILFSYPILIVLTRGNVAILVFVSLAFFILRIENIIFSMLFLAIATSIKITPVIFIIYFLVYYQNNWKKIVAGLACFVLFIAIINYLSVSLVSAAVSPTVYDPFYFFKAVDKYENVYIEQFQGLRYGSSFYMALRYVINILDKHTGLGFFHFLLNIKPLIVNFTVFLLLLGLYLWRFSFEKLKAFILNRDNILKVVSIVFVLFTPVTADYYLTILILPLFFIRFEHFKLPERIFYLLILIPKNYFFYHFISLQVFINPLLLLAMLLVVTGLYDFNFIVSKNQQLKTGLKY
jgi:hypothetical protein